VVSLEIKGRNRYELDVRKGGSSIKSNLEEEGSRKIIQDIFEMRPMYVPSVGAVSPAENFMPYPQLKARLDEGKISESWRAYLHWLYNDSGKEVFEQVIEIAERHLPGVRILAPTLTHDSPAQVGIQFEEQGTILDIGASGGGLRTVLNVASVICLSNSKCILLDEPDAHLHGSLQRAVAAMLLDYAAESGLQMIVATHAPDFIGEIPVEDLVWVDRADDCGRRCTDLGRVLSDLGAITKADAIRAYGADKILFMEGPLDGRVLKKLLGLAPQKNPFEDNTVIKPTLPGGKGEAKNLPAFKRLLRETLQLDVKIACITDNDYEIPQASSQGNTPDSDCLFLSVGCKEIENYLLDAAVIAEAARSAAEDRKRGTAEYVDLPTAEQIKEQIQSIIHEDTILKTMRCQAIPRWQENLHKDLDPSTKFSQAEDWFDQKWKDNGWRLRNCPGKLVLGNLRKWCQDEFSITLTDSKLIAALKVCPNDIVELSRKLNAYFYSTDAELGDDEGSRH